MRSEITEIYNSSIITINDFKCGCDLKGTSGSEYRSSFTMSYVRKGNFMFNVFKESLDSFNGRILLNKPGFEHTVTHFDGMPDECTIFGFTNDFYEIIKTEFSGLSSKFFNNNQVQSLLIKAGPEIECIHSLILKTIKTCKYSKLSVETLTLEMLRLILYKIYELESPEVLTQKIKKHHLTTLERAKYYINENYDKDISLSDLAENSFVSPFHFSRIFKIFTSYSPHQFLVDTRLKHAEWMIKSTDLPITQICLDTGFRSLEYFSSAFKNKYGISPSKARL